MGLITLSDVINTNLISYLELCCCIIDCSADCEAIHLKPSARKMLVELEVSY